MATKFSLSTKLLLIQALGLILILGAVGLFLYQSIRAETYHEVEHSGRSIVQAFEEVLVEHPQLLTTEALQPIVHRFVAKIPNVERVSVIDDSGRIIADSLGQSVGQPVDQSELLSLLQDPGELSLSYEREGRPYLQIMNSLEGRYDPVRQSNVVGVVAITLHLSNAEQTIRDTFVRMLEVLGGLFFLYLLLQHLIIRYILIQPVYQLARVIRRLGGGDLAIRARVDSHDEIGELTTAFNYMADQLETKEAALLDEIAERQQTEATLAAERNLLRTLIDNLPEYIYIKDTESRFITANITLAQDVGMSTPNELAGKTDFDIFSQELAAQYYADEQAVIQSGQALISREEVAMYPNGKKGWASTTTLPLRDSEGQIVGLVGLSQNITERKQFEDTLTKERNLMRILLDNLPLLISVRDTECRFVLVNHASLQIGQQTMAEIIGKTDFDINPPELAAQYYADDQAVINSGQPIFDREERNISAGQLRWFSTTKVPLRDTQGQIIGIVAMSHDITARKQIETALAEERNLLRTLIDNLPDNIYVKDTEGRHLMVNRAAMQGVGVDTKEEMLGKTDLELYLPELAQPWYADDMAVIQSGQPIINREEPALDAAGCVGGWDLTTKVPLYDSRGQVTGLVGVTRDITEQKRAEKALRENEALLRTVVDATPDWIFIKDQAHRFRLINQSYADALHLSPQACLGKDELDLGFPEEIVKGNPDKGIRGFWTSDREVLDTGESRFIPEASAVMDGLPVIQNTVKVPLRDEVGNVWGVLGFAHNITELKRIQEELLRAKEAAEAATHAKSNFLATMSHEIRTPMNGVIGVIGLLLGTELTKRQQELAHIAGTSAEALLIIINDILDFSKIEAGQLTITSPSSP